MSNIKFAFLALVFIALSCHVEEPFLDEQSMTGELFVKIVRARHQAGRWPVTLANLSQSSPRLSDFLSSGQVEWFLAPADDVPDSLVALLIPTSFEGKRIFVRDKNGWRDIGTDETRKLRSSLQKMPLLAN